MVKIIGVKFNHTCKVYYFSADNIDVKKGDGVIVETVRGTEYGKVVIEPTCVDESEIVAPLKPVLRKATKKDEDTVVEHENKVPWVIKTAEEEIINNRQFCENSLKFI